MERALAAASVLRPSQRDNVRKKARDLAGGRAVWESVPFRVILEPNRLCNIRCVMCDNVHNQSDVLPARTIERLFDEIGWGAMEIMPFASGEPTLAPMQVLAPVARKHNLFFNFITNGILFTAAYHRAIQDRVARVQFSIHSHRREIAESIAPGQDFGLVTGNLRDSLAIARETGAQVLPGMVVMNRNFDGLADYVRFMAALGARRLVLSRLFPTSRLYTEEGIERHRSAAEIEDASLRALEAALECGVHVESNFDVIVRDPRNQQPAAGPFDILQDNAHVVELFRPGYCISTAITVFLEWDGTVLPCYRDRIVLGNLEKQTFAEVWNGEAMQRHRRTFLDRQLAEFCARCQAFFCGHA